LALGSVLDGCQFDCILPANPLRAAPFLCSAVELRTMNRVSCVVREH
jgi:hypothetical protein